MVSQETLREEIRNLILERFAMGYEGLEFQDNLSACNVLDSLQMVEFIIALEDRFKVRVEPSAVIPENFATIAAIAAYLEPLLAA